MRAIRIKSAIGYCVSFLSVEKWVQLTDKCYSMCKDNHSKKVSCPTGRKHYFGEMYLRKDICVPRKAEFEGNLWDIPDNVEMYLKRLYGNYMQIPDEGKRERHSVLELKLGDYNFACSKH